jgi:hypothetical protein
VVHLEITGDHLDLRLDGSDAVWALRRHLQVPLAHVASARVVPRGEVLPAGIRLGGTWVSGRIAAGRFWRPSRGRSFWSIRRAREVLVVELQDHRYRRLVLEVDDPDARAAEISAAVSA